MIRKMYEQRLPIGDFGKIHRDILESDISDYTVTHYPDRDCHTNTLDGLFLNDTSVCFWWNNYKITVPKKESNDKTYEVRIFEVCCKQMNDVKWMNARYNTKMEEVVRLHTL